MKRTLILASAGLVALVSAGLAVANGIEGAKSAKAVAGGFATGTPSQFRTRSCTTSDGKTLVATEGVYTGTATGATAGDADLSGPITLRARSLINSTDGIGVVSGTLRIDVASGGDTVAHFDTVYNGGSIAGLASGHAQDPHAKLLANILNSGNLQAPMSVVEERTVGPELGEDSIHAGMKVDNAEFDAAVGDMKATLDKLSVGTDEQKELLAIVESTRPQIVEKK